MAVVVEALVEAAATMTLTDAIENRMAEAAIAGAEMDGTTIEDTVPVVVDEDFEVVLQVPVEVDIIPQPQTVSMVDRVRKLSSICRND